MCFAYHHYVSGYKWSNAWKYNELRCFKKLRILQPCVGAARGLGYGNTQSTGILFARCAHEFMTISGASIIVEQIISLTLS
jgi:hypothetical protein